MRASLGFAVAAALLLGGLIGVIVLATSSGSDVATPASRHCLEAWNSDPEAIAFGRHNSLSHGYGDVEVGYMPEEGSASLSSDRDTGECAVVFAAQQLDPEAFAVGQIRLHGAWLPLSGLLEPADLVALQRAALGGANATVTSQGRLIAK